MIDRRRRALSTAFRLGVLVLAVAITASLAPSALRHLPRQDLIALALVLVLFTLLARINIPLDSQAFARKRGTEPGRIMLELPLILTVVDVYGPVIAAALTLVAYPIAASGRGGSSGLFRRLFQGAPQAILWLFAGALRLELYPGRIGLSIGSYLAFVAFYVLAFYMFLYGVWTPLRMLSTQTSLRRLWRNLSRDSRLMVLLLLLTSWGYVCTIGWSQIGIAFGLASLAPLPFLAIALRQLHENQIELHRLRLARDAVQAMLGAGDPIPQMNSLLASLHTPAAHETLQIYAAITPSDMRLAPLASIGPHPKPEQMELGTRALQELNRSDRPAVIVRNSSFFAFGHAARASDDALLGVLLVHRPYANAQFVDRKRMTDAAADLAPLLRDFRSIAATQNAAALDMLTGMPNRRTIMQLLRDRVDNVAIGGACAVFLVDIDRFKSINDTLGHQAGDHCLRSIGQTIVHSIRSNDRCGRIGGEEFLILMPDTNAETAVAIGERLRAAISTLDVRHADGEHVTVSIGVAVATVSDTVESLLARADHALYQAKRQGRNRVVEAHE
ncbi:MAG TPA: GGDEF domain-containing protein [Candidatus Rubrimentiphilum sp.]|nr:GGDEF domain-containing protein [Candidatus Rubrimentiphilum sp.]